MKFLFNVLAVLVVAGAVLLVNDAASPSFHPVTLFDASSPSTSSSMEIADTPQAQAAQFVWHLRFGNAGGSAVAYHSYQHEGKYHTLWLTAKHCVDSKEPYGFLTPSIGKAWLVPFHVVARHPLADLAVLESTSDFCIRTVKISQSVPKFGEKLFVAGWTLGKGLFLHVGFQTSQVYRCSATIAPGDSGGAVLNTEGELVGIVVATGYLKKPFEQLLGGMTRFEPVVWSRAWIKAWIIVKKS